MGTARSLALLQSLTQRFVKDVQATAGLQALVTIAEQQDFYDAVLRLGRSGTGLRVLQRLLDEDRGEEVLVQLADDWSEPVMEEVLATAGVEEARQWPKCPRHSHALNPELRTGQACWCCAFDQTVAFPVGQMPPAESPGPS